MTDERDERRFERAGASLRTVGAHDSHALGEVVSALRPGELALLIVYRPRPISTFRAKVEVEDRR